MGVPVHTPLKNSGRTYGDGKITSCSEVVVEVVLLSIRLVVVVVVPWQWMPMDLLLLILPYWPWEVTVWTEAPEVQADQSAYRPIIFSLTANSLLDVTGGANGGAGGRIFLSGRVTLNNEGEDNLVANPGEGVNLGSRGSIRFDRLIEQSNLLSFSGTLTIDTNLGIMEHSDGTRNYGIIEDRTYRHDDGTTWPYSVCHFVFEIQLGGSLVINLKGDNGLVMEARSGDFILGADIRADGGHASSSDGSGGMAILGGYNGAPAGQLLGNGPGKPAESSEQGHGAGHGGHGSGGASEIGHPSLE